MPSKNKIFLMDHKLKLNINTTKVSYYHFYLDNAAIIGASLLPTISTNSDQVAEET
jgi:hypothetical protein